jgi:energy-coupling factor transport system permease protein
VRPALAPVPRALHPGAWWAWALGLSTAVSRTTNPLLLVLAVSVAGYVVALRRGDAPWARAYRVFLALGVAVLVLRVAVSSVMGPQIPGHVLVTLPRAHLPQWAAGVRLGGPVTVEGMVAASYDGLQLAALLACLGAANALANPSRLLAAVPGALYEAGVAVVVAMSFAPQALVAVRRVRAAQRLRGRPDRGLRGLGGLVRPVLEGALERSLDLAASMDSRGYGRSAGQSRRARRTTGALVLAGLLGVVAGVYGLLDGGSPALLGLPLLGLGAGLAAAGLAVGGRRVRRTRYRPDPWALPEWLVTASGVAVAAVFVAASGDARLRPAAAPLAVPPLPAAALVGLLVALLPALAAPPLPRRRGGGQVRRDPAGAVTA